MKGITMRFFEPPRTLTERAVDFMIDATTIRFPMTAMEGFAKGLIAAGMVLGPYDLFFGFPDSAAEQALHSERIVSIYLVSVLTGFLGGLINQCYTALAVPAAQQIRMR